MHGPGEKRVKNIILSIFFYVNRCTKVLISTVWTGVSQVMDRDISGVGQCGNVELEVGVLGPTVPGPAAVSEGIHAVHVIERRIPHPEERASLWEGERKAHEAALICYRRLVYVLEIEGFEVLGFGGASSAP